MTVTIIIPFLQRVLCLCSLALHLGQKTTQVTHGLFIFIGEYLGLSCSNYYTVLSTQRCPTHSYRGTAYIIQMVTLTTYFFLMMLVQLVYVRISSEGLQQPGYDPILSLCGQLVVFTGLHEFFIAMWSITLLLEHLIVVFLSL